MTGDTSGRRKARQRTAIAMTLVMPFLAAGCSSGPQVPQGMPGHVAGFAGLVAADEPQAAQIARDVLSAGGTCADAAVAAVFALTVTLPSQAGLGGGGQCVVFDAQAGTAEALDFVAPAPVPGMPRGLFALHSKYGRLRWESVVSPAENLARFGSRVSRAFGNDIALAGSRLQDGGLYSAKREGDHLAQLDLAALLSRIRTRGPGDLHAGAYAAELAAALTAAGAGVSADALRGYVPRWTPAPTVTVGDDTASVTPAGRDAAVLLEGGRPAGRSGSADGTGLVVMDAAGSMVACGLTMGAPFGAGRLVPGTGMLMAAAGAPPPAMVVGNAKVKEPRLAAVAAGSAAPVALAATASHVLRSGRQVAEALAAAPPGSERLNAIACRSGRPSAARCATATDPRGAGLAIVVGQD